MATVTHGLRLPGDFAPLPISRPSPASKFPVCASVMPSPHSQRLSQLWPKLTQAETSNRNGMSSCFGFASFVLPISLWQPNPRAYQRRKGLKFVKAAWGEGPNRNKAGKTRTEDGDSYYKAVSSLTVTEVHKLLQEAPTTQHALQLAARLRRAARDGRKTKDGRLLDASVIDDALDMLLDAGMGPSRGSGANDARNAVPECEVAEKYELDEGHAEGADEDGHENRNENSGNLNEEPSEPDEFRLESQVGTDAGEAGLQEAIKGGLKQPMEDGKLYTAEELWELVTRPIQTPRFVAI